MKALPFSYICVKCSILKSLPTFHARIIQHEQLFIVENGIFSNCHFSSFPFQIICEDSYCFSVYLTMYLFCQIPIISLAETTLFFFLCCRKYRASVNIQSYPCTILGDLLILFVTLAHLKKILQKYRQSWFLYKKKKKFNFNNAKRASNVSRQ